MTGAKVGWSEATAAYCLLPMPIRLTILLALASLTLFCREIVSLNLLSSHPNISKLLATKATVSEVTLVFPFYPFTMSQVNAKLPFVDSSELILGISKIVTTDVLKALAHCHSHNIVHRDVKPDNILIDFGPMRAVAVLCDFGLARVLDTEDEEKIPENRF